MALNYNKYQVKPGDDLLKISQQVGTDYQDLLKANPGIQWVNQGQVINLPKTPAPPATFGPPEPPGPYSMGNLGTQARTTVPNVVGSQNYYAHGGRASGGYVYPGGVINEAGGINNLIGGANQQAGGSAFTGEVGKKYTTSWGGQYMITQTDKEGVVTAERKIGNYGVSGGKWRTYVTKDAEGNWRKVTTTARGNWQRKKPGGKGSGVSEGGGWGQQTVVQQPVQQPILEQVMSWRVATG